ncbi:MAG TPA: hypothetical protein VG537_04790 [Candidatus Kapabacteria bacterium]|jgi:hypothetical protein|nr:hypothetical protein [Candidatus Kapabacteria bacterium]
MGITIELIANIALALSFVVGLIFGIAQVKAAQRDRRERLTLETLRVFNTREFAETIHFMRVLAMPKTQEEFFTMPTDQQIMLIQGSQQMESLGMLVFERYIDLDLVDKTIGSFVSTTWAKYKPVFEDMRMKLPDPYLGEYFQWLADQVDQKIQQNREPYYKQKDRWHTMKH